MKPMLFSTEMVRAILDGRKTVTRRVLKNQDENTFYADSCEDKDYGCVNLICENADGTKYVLYNKAPYQPGDILYVRETWAEVGGFSPQIGEFWQQYIYKATYKPNFNLDVPSIKWHPSIHMPKEAARLFLRVIGVQVERLQDITTPGATKRAYQIVILTHLALVLAIPVGKKTARCVNLSAFGTAPSRSKQTAPASAGTPTRGYGL